MNLFGLIRRRIAALGVVLAMSAFCCGLGLLFTFYLAPRQSLEAIGTSRLPQMDAGAVEQAAAGDTLLITGLLEKNEQLFEEEGLVAYRLEEWQVTLPDPEDEGRQPRGEWVDTDIALPDLQLLVDGRPVLVQTSPEAGFAGPVREVVVPGDGPEAEDSRGQAFAGGTLRYRGFANGDRVTVHGVKASGGGVLPDTLFAGDRVAFEQYQLDNARGLLMAGISMLICAPIVLVGGGLAALFGRRR